MTEKESIAIEVEILQWAIQILESWAEDHDDPKWKKHNQDAANLILESIADEDGGY